MRRFITCALALAGLTWANSASAQEKVAAPATIKTEACASACLEKVCIAVPDKKKTTKVVYGCTTKDICLLKCPKHFGRGCDDSCADCGRPRTVNVLMKKSVTTECDSTKCVISHREAAPKCTTRCRSSCTPACTTTTTGAATPPAGRAAAPAATEPRAIGQALPQGAPAITVESSR